MIDLHLAMIIKTDTDLTVQDPIPTVIDAGVTVRVIHRVTPGHITDTHTQKHIMPQTLKHISP